MLYRRRSTPLHAAGPGAAITWCGGLVLAALIVSGPVMLAVVTLTVLVAAVLADVWLPVRRALLWALILGLTVCVINAFVSQQGATVLWRFGDLPLLGERYITLQAVGYGATLGLRAVALVLVGALYSLAVDPDAVLALTRRLSFRSALTATIATRMVPVLLRDSQRLSEAQRTRSGPPPGRVALLQAATSGMLDRALDVAATLEVRGFGLARVAAGSGGPHSRHDRAFGLAGICLVIAVIGARMLSPWLIIALPLMALAPFLDRRGIR